MSYLVVVAFALSSLWQKTKSGSSLPATQPSGLFGAAEGLSFVSVLAGLAVLGVLAADKGSPSLIIRHMSPFATDAFAVAFRGSQG